MRTADANILIVAATSILVLELAVVEARVISSYGGLRQSGGLRLGGYRPNWESSFVKRRPLPTSRWRPFNMHGSAGGGSQPLVDLSDFEEDLKNAFVSELRGRIKDEMGELMVTGGQSEWEGDDGDLGGRPRHKMLPPSLMKGFNGVNDARNWY